MASGILEAPTANTKIHKAQPIQGYRVKKEIEEGIRTYEAQPGDT